MVQMDLGVARGIENQTKVAAGLSTGGRMWLIFEEAGDCERPFRCIADGSGECDRLFHSFREIRLTCLSFAITAVQGGVMACREIERQLGQLW